MYTHLAEKHIDEINIFGQFMVDIMTINDDDMYLIDTDNIRYIREKFTSELNKIKLSDTASKKHKEKTLNTANFFIHLWFTHQQWESSDSDTKKIYKFSKIEETTKSMEIIGDIILIEDRFFVKDLMKHMFRSIETKPTLSTIKTAAETIV
jgi:hypothetical protein